MPYTLGSQLLAVSWTPVEPLVREECKALSDCHTRGHVACNPVAWNLKGAKRPSMKICVVYVVTMCSLRHVCVREYTECEGARSLADVDLLFV